ncbi:MAG: ABC transporter ATP-binding protein [Acidimicrobiaceae bacterium]|nr:ABC transporter ATP-binding protein [Acidimicrobiaceae bacterium]
MLEARRCRTGAISIEALSARLGNTDVLADVDLELERGEWLNVIGANGAGKTTLLRCILGSVDYRGTIDIDGLDAAGGPNRARMIAYVPQVPVIPPGMAVIDYVLLGRTPHRGAFAGDSEYDLAVASTVLDRLDLHGFADREVNTLSGGERQRAVLARALAQQTPILLLDEPTTALDLGHQQDVLDLIDELRRERGLTVLATLHDLTLAARYGERIAVLSNGAVAVTGKPAEVLTVSLIAEHFRANVRIIDDPAGPVIVPVAHRPAKDAP